MSTTLQPQPAAHPHPHPARMTLRALLTYLLTAALIATSIVLATATASHASPGNHRPATWNMQGASSSTDSKWTTTVTRLLTGGYNYLPHDVLALQEAGPRSSLPGTVVYASTLTVNGRQATYDYEVRRWQVGSSTRGRTVYITWLNTDPTGNRNNVAIVTDDYPQSFEAVAARQANNTSWGMRPALGVRLTDGSWFYSFHASSNGDNRSNDAQNMLVEVSSRGGQWAVLGDFNRNPANITVPPGSQIYRSGMGTQQGGGELDYMVSNDGQNMQGWTGRRMNGAGSDHFPVEFLFRANASNRDIVQSAADPSTCLQVVEGGRQSYTNEFNPDTNRLAALTCSDSSSSWAFAGNSSTHWLVSDDRCLHAFNDVKWWGGSWVKGAEPYMRWCSEEYGDQVENWYRTEADNTIRHWKSSFCLYRRYDSRVVQETCDGSPSQEWIRPGFSPYVWTVVSTTGPSTGTEDAQTGGSSGSGDSGDGSCPMPPNPTLDPCHHISKRSTTDVNIVDNSTVHSPIAVNDIGGAAPSTLGVGVDIKHTYRGDLDLHLVAPDGSSYHLEDIPDGDSGDDVFKSYTVNASSESANGTWQLRAIDTATGDEGYIDAWNLTFPADGSSGDSSGDSSGGSSSGSSSGYTAGDFENTDDKTISDYTTVESPIAASGLGSGNAPSDLKVSVDIKHTWIGDLKIWLVGPQGGQWLLEDPLGSGVNILKTYTVNASSEPAEGLWRLKVEDNAGGDVGYIDRWSLTFD
ncbi:proprotein convertase P-domain-containing protein [Streptomyces sp. MUM 136J]|uniref:proprotein convertase P-domain-containing protein n=1 Tax=Streptomyces sp. MUM 136J TaxID=2791992 RepID=UPI001F04454F|nr:proprotein convertase P-domain-containing protein [Streptomyces sp. MUM 136J]